MEEIKSLFFKVVGVRNTFFQCLHTRGGLGPVHPSQGPILAMLFHCGEGSQADIVRKMKVSAATVAVSIARLEKMGLVSRERNQANQRAYVLRLTEKGREVAGEMERTMTEMGRVAMKGFSPEECETLKDYCDRMIQNLQEHYKTKE